MRSLLRRALSKLLPGTWSAPGCGVPSACSGDTTVASTATGTPPAKGSPVTTQSMRRQSAGSMLEKAAFLSRNSSCTLPPLSRKTRAQAFSTGRARTLKRPAHGQAAALSPSWSSCFLQPPQQVPPARKSGQLSLRRKDIWNRNGAIVKAPSEGSARSQALAGPPALESNRAFRRGQLRDFTSSSRKWFSEKELR